MDRESLRKIQSIRLKKIVDYVYHNTPFYRKKMQEMGITPDDINSIDDIVKLPFTTKHDLRDNYPFGLCAVPMSQIVRIHASSGTTGKPTVVGYTRKDLSTWAECISRAFTAYGAGRSDIFQVSYGYGLFTGGLGAHAGAENIGASVIPMSSGNTEKQITLMHDFGSTVLCCTPSYALYLADAIKDSGLPREEFQLKVGAFGAEPWTENMRHEIEEKLGIDCFSIISNYKAIVKKELMYNKNVSEKVRELSSRLERTKNENEFFDEVTEFYKAFGVGMFGLNKAFRISSDEKDGLVFHPINNMDKVVLDDLIGYEIQKQKLVENTENFVQGRKANNALLFGDSGTGKSTSIKAIVNQYYDQGLRMIEIYKHQFKDLSNVIASIKNRNYKFIIYMDDLSFEEFEIEYKFLKAVIEGGVETKPENILIYATSNRRHLIKETWNDRNDMETTNGLHRSDTIEEKMSLVNRFGCQICYSKPSNKEYYDIVIGLARKSGLDMTDEELMAEANKWELSHGGISGRTAQQFINHCLGMQRSDS